jgi:hypothetical protein
MQEVRDRQVTYTMAEAQELLLSQIRPAPGIEDDDPDCLKAFMVEGPAGIGKSRMLRQVANRAEARLVSHHHGATVEEDNHGLPYVKEGVVTNAPPAHIAPALQLPGENPDELVMLLFEEACSGSTSGHQNFFRMVIDRQFHQTPLKRHCHIVGTTNPETADYSTVRSLDRSLAARLVMIHLKPTADEKLGYWSKRMDSYLYKFLLLNHLNAGKLDYVEALDSRTWFNLAHTLAKARHARIATNTLVKLLSAHAGKEIGASFADYAVHGEDPEKYPIGHKEFLTADGDKLKDLLGRVGRWASDNQTPLIGATQWDLASWIKDQTKDQTKDTSLSPGEISRERAARNIAKFMIDIGTAGYADLARSMVDSLRKTPFLRAVLSEIKGTPLEKKFIAVFERFEADKVEVKETQKEEAAVA